MSICECSREQIGLFQPLSYINVPTMARSVHEEVEPASTNASPHGPGTADPLLLEFLSNRNDEVFATLARKILPRLLRYFGALGCKRDEAEDLVQDVLCTFYQKAHGIREPQYMWAWLYKVAHNALLQSVRRSSRQVPAVDIEAIGEDCLPPHPLSQEQEMYGSSFSDWMAWLETGEQQVMVLRFVEDCDYSEIAQMLEIPIGTVKSRLFQAKKKLARHLSDAGRRSKSEEKTI